MSELGAANIEPVTRKEVEKPRFLLRYPASGTISVEIPSTKSEESPAEMARRIREDREKGRHTRGIDNDRVSLVVTSQPPKDIVVKLPVTLDRVEYFKPSQPLAKKHEAKFSNSVWMEKVELTPEQVADLKKKGKLLGLNSLPLTKDVKEKIAPLLEKDIAKV